MAEEATIVSANRQLPPEHPVFRILRPHWQKTLALNGAARITLVPKVILNIVGFDKDQATSFIRDEYSSFDFENSYVPKDLRRRGVLSRGAQRQKVSQLYLRQMHQQHVEQDQGIRGRNPFPGLHRSYCRPTGEGRQIY